MYETWIEIGIQIKILFHLWIKRKLQKKWGKFISKLMSRIFKYEPLCVRPRYTLIQIIFTQKLYVTKLGNKNWGKYPLLAIRTYTCKEFFKFSDVTVKMRPGIDNITYKRFLYLLYLHSETSKCKGNYLKSFQNLKKKIHIAGGP